MNNIFPEIILTLFALGALLGGVFFPNKKILGIFAFFGVVISAIFLPISSETGTFFFSGMLINDGFSVFFRAVILLISTLVILFSIGYKDLKEDAGEYYFFVLSVTVSMLLAVASNNLMMIYIALEGISILSYIMAGYLKRDIFSSEAGIKYFLFGAVSTGVTLYGVSLIYGLFGTLDLSLITEQLKMHSINQPALFLSLILVLAGFSFKCSLVPFHMWTPDVYQGAPTPVAALFSVGPKAVGFAFLLRIFVLTFPGNNMPWVTVMGIMAILTMTIGNVMAVQQNNIKRLLAYSTIAQAGYILAGFVVATPAGIEASLFYIFVYSLMNLGAFGAVIMVSNALGSETIEHYSGLYKKDPLSAVVLAICLLSLAGVPPLAGFLAKFFILWAAIQINFTVLAIFIVVNSVIAFYYYVKIIKFMFLEDSKEPYIFQKTPAIALGLVFILVANILFGLWPHPILEWLSGLL